MTCFACKCMQPARCRHELAEVSRQEPMQTMPSRQARSAADQRLRVEGSWCSTMSMGMSAAPLCSHRMSSTCWSSSRTENCFWAAPLACVSKTTTRSTPEKQCMATQRLCGSTAAIGVSSMGLPICSMASPEARVSSCPLAESQPSTNHTWRSVSTKSASVGRLVGRNTCM